MHITVDNLLGVCDQKVPINMGPTLNVYGAMDDFLILINALCELPCHTSWSLV